MIGAVSGLMNASVPQETAGSVVFLEGLDVDVAELDELDDLFLFQLQYLLLVQLKTFHD